MASVSRALPLWRLTHLRRRMFERFGSRAYSQPSYNEIGLRLRKHLAAPGIFVEAGAVDGFFESNTYELERFYGWRGVLVEPVPEMFRRIALTRPSARAVNCALVADERLQPFVDIESAHALSRILLTSRHPSTGVDMTGSPGLIRVPARALSSLLDEMRIDHVDLLSLDVEGFEIEVMKGLDFRRHKPSLLIVECLTSEARNDMDEFLAGHFTFLDNLSHRDVLYRAV